MFFVTFLRVSLALSIFHPKNRASFVSLIKSYRSSLELLYHNWSQLDQPFVANKHIEGNI